MQDMLSISVWSYNELPGSWMVLARGALSPVPAKLESAEMDDLQVDILSRQPYL